jgi:hypothetical protein
MTAITATFHQAGHVDHNWASMGRIRAWLVSSVFILSFMSTFQPAPTDYVFVLTVLACLTGGLRFSLVLMPLLFLLLIYNFAGVFSYMFVEFDSQNSKQYLLGLAYTSFSGFFFAAYVAEDGVNRFNQITRAYWVGGTIGAVLGLIGYFNVEPIAAYLPTFDSRAVGFYKDPNVFSTWLVFPVVTMLQGFLLGTLKLRPLAVTSFALMFAALFLAFSRGAWINVLMSISLMVALMLFFSPTPGFRIKISLAAVGGILLAALLLSVILSIPETRETFLDRFTLVKSYDAGETGRFGNQLNAIPMLIERPLGFGPYQFAAIFDLAPHNTFLNSFAAGGWVGGIAFIVFVMCSIVVGVKLVMVRSDFQVQSIAAFSCLIAVIFQGVQIDTEHWRHLYWMVGLVWGLFAASIRHVIMPPGVDVIHQNWNVKPA